MASPSAQPVKKAKVENGGSPVPRNGERTPVKDESKPVVIVDMDSEEYRDAHLSPSPEKVLLDHSYSSPQSKSNNPSAEAAEGEAAQRGSPRTEKPTAVMKQGLLKALGSVKSEVSAKAAPKTSKKTKAAKNDVSKYKPVKKRETLRRKWK